MSSPLKNKLLLVHPAKVLARGVIVNLVDFAEADIPAMNQQKEMLLRLERTFYGWFVLAYADDAILPAPPAGLTKLDLIVAAAESTASALENLVDALVIDIATADPAVIGQNTLAWQIFLDHYRWLHGSLADDVYWPAAPAGLGDNGGVTPLPPAVGSPALTGQQVIDLLLPLVGTPAAKPLLEAVKSAMLSG